jgi:hypothetical protein
MYNNISPADAERALVGELLWHLEPEALDRWSACKSSHRFLSFVNKKLIVYKMVGGQREVVDTLTCLDVTMTNLGGFQSKWLSTLTCESIEVGAVPVEVHPSVFLWHTFYSDVRYQSYKGKYTIRFSMLYKSRHNPKFLSDNSLYILEQAIFESGATSDLV